MAAAIENPSWVDHHAGRMNFARDDAFGLNFHAAFGEDHAVKAAGNDHLVSFNLSFDFGAFAENYRLFRNDVAFDVAVDAECAFDLQRPFHGDALIDEACPLFTRTVLCMCPAIATP